ncbi:MAG: aldehyde dehydrogenase family protein, partial [Sphingobium sp.]
LPPETGRGTFVPSTIIELPDLAELKREVFGPVLHVIRYRRERLDELIDAINATGYGLTFGLHTRLDETVEHITSRVKAGNLYINRNIIGAIVGVQPFGGRGLSGTGPKAGGPLYLRRLVQAPSVRRPDPIAPANPALSDFTVWLEAQGEAEMANVARAIGTASPLGIERELPGPVGERNLHALHPRGTVLLRPMTPHGLFHQIAVALATGNRMTIEADDRLTTRIEDMPERVRQHIDAGGDGVSVALVEGKGTEILSLLRNVADRPGAIIPVHAAAPEQMLSPAAYCTDWLVEEVSTSINTTAAGGNASLIAMV